MRVAVGVAVLSALAIAGSAPARQTPVPEQKQALAQIAKAAGAGRIEPATARRGRAAVIQAAALIRRLPPARRTVLEAMLGQIAALRGKLTEPRAVAVFGQLVVTNGYLAEHRPPAPETDITDEDGVVYRWFTGRGFVFHPLANFGALNAAVNAGDAGRTERLADALLARATPQPGGGLGWEYYFDYAGGRAPWTSGMAQAVAAQAFSGAASLGAGDSTALLSAARGAYRAIPGRLVRKVGPGPWIRLYSFARDVVLNAQLQAIVSLRTYADRTHDTGAATLASLLQKTAVAELPSFDTGYWTYYSLPHNSSPLDYQQYVVQLLRKLASADERFGEAAARIAGYEQQPPVFRLADAGVGAVRFWLSRPSSVRVTAFGPARQLWLGSGWHDVRWPLPRRPGIYPVKVTARDGSGHQTSIEALPIVKVAAPPPPKAKKKSAVAALRTKTSATGVSAAAGAAPSADASPTFLVGAGIDDASELALAQQAKLGAVRLAVPWPLGATAPDAVTLATLRRVPQSLRMIVELGVDPLPADESLRGQLAAYAAALVKQVPAVRDVWLAPAPFTGTAAAYADTLAAVYDAVRAVRSTAAVGAVLDGAASPKATLAALAAAVRAAGRTVPSFDELAFRPAAGAARNAWTLGDQARLASALASGFAGTSQPGSELPIFVDGLAVETTIPSAKSGVYLLPPDPSAGVSETEQATAYAQALESADCRTHVAGFLLDRLVDAPEPGEQSGLFYADRTAKASAAPAGRAFEAAASGRPGGCPGLGVSAAARDLVFPTRLSRGAAPSVRLGCVRDCLYLVTLDRPDGTPVLARRGALSKNVAATTVRLPRLPVPAGSYTLSVRIVTQSDPGPIELLTSPALPLR